MKPKQTHSETHTRDTTERDIARGKECVREREKEVLTYDGWQRSSRRWRWQSVLRAAIASIKGGNGVNERQLWWHGVESEGLFESLVMRVIDLSLVVRVSWEFFQFRVFFLLFRGSDLLRFSFSFFLFLFIPNPELCFIKRNSVWIEAVFNKT